MRTQQWCCLLRQERHPAQALTWDITGTFHFPLSTFSNSVAPLLLFCCESHFLIPLHRLQMNIDL